MKVVRHTLLIFCMLLIGALAASKAYSQSIVIKNNLLYDATLTPNLEAEVKIGQRQTAGLILGFNPFPLKDEFSYDGDNKKMRHLLVAPMWRYWFCEAFAGHFVSCNVAYVHYNVSNKKFPFGLFKESIRSAGRVTLWRRERPTATHGYCPRAGSGGGSGSGCRLRMVEEIQVPPLRNVHRQRKPPRGAAEGRC